MTTKIQKQTPITREDLLKKITPIIREKVLPGIGMVRYRHLSFQAHYQLQAYSSDPDEFAARVIVAGFVEPAFTEADIPALKSGQFGAIMRLGSLPLEDMNSSTVTEEDLGK